MASVADVQKAIESGDRAQAAQLLKGILRDAPNADAWYYAAQLTNDPENKIKYLQKAIALDYNHKPSLALLKQLGEGVSSANSSDTPQANESEKNLTFRAPVKRDGKDATRTTSTVARANANVNVGTMIDNSFAGAFFDRIGLHQRFARLGVISILFATIFLSVGFVLLRSLGVGRAPVPTPAPTAQLYIAPEAQQYQDVMLSMNLTNPNTIVKIENAPMPAGITAQTHLMMTVHDLDYINNPIEHSVSLFLYAPQLTMQAMRDNRQAVNDHALGRAAKATSGANLYLVYPEALSTLMQDALVSQIANANLANSAISNVTVQTLTPSVVATPAP